MPRDNAYTKHKMSYMTRREQEAHWAALLADGSPANAAAAAAFASHASRSQNSDASLGAAAASLKAPTSSKELRADVDGLLGRFLGKEIPKLGGQVCKYPIVSLNFTPKTLDKMSHLSRRPRHLNR